MSKNDMVMVRERLSEIANRDSAVSVTVRADDLRAILAEQHQGEPVAFVRFRNGEPDYDGDACMIMNVPGDTLGDGDSWEAVYTHPPVHGEPVALPERMVKTETSSDEYDLCADSWNACLDEIAKLGALYTRADSGEVERLHLEIEKLRLSLTLNDDALIQDGFVRIENRAMRSRLDEQDELLREIKNARDWNGSYRSLLKRIDAALSASAEPSAPATYPIDMKTMMQAYEQVDHKALLHGTSNWCSAMATALRGVLNIEPSAPVEIDERAEFERENRYIVLKRNRLSFLPMELQSRLKCALDDAQAILPKLDCVVVEKDWPEYEAVWASIAARVARAALERKP